ncbi:unnamed protein product [Aphanomyces euteiches]
MQERMYNILHAWIESMQPPQKMPSAFEENWRHSQLMKGDDETRLLAQKWIIQQAHHSTERAFAPIAFPETMEPFIQVDVGANEQDEFFFINTMTHCVLPYALEHVSDALWVTERRFLKYHRDGILPTTNELKAILSETLCYGREVDLSVLRVNITKNSLRGQIRDHDRTTIIFRTIVHDEAFPLEDNNSTVNLKEWMVADRLGPSLTRLRTFYTMNHPATDHGYIPMELLATEFNIPRDGYMNQRVRDHLRASHSRQRETFYEHLTKMLHLIASM